MRWNLKEAEGKALARVMASIGRFLDGRLRLPLNVTKSVVGRPWQGTYPGYSMTSHRTPRLRVAADVVQRFRSGLRAVFRRGRGRSLATVLAELKPILTGWMNDFCDIEVKGVLQALDGWLRRKLRNLLWRRWKRSDTRARNPMRHGLPEARAWTSATNGRGLWWYAGASHVHQGFPKSFFDRQGLVVSLLDHYHRLQHAS